ncbi:MAG: UDP-N-acetylglucosamine 2-epimerase [Candidatus Moranbacteria bacterium]|nr:UDP-N-acetylglucosamine 2-epimerase [Candidatus Moranbacteria bacterium]
MQKENLPSEITFRDEFFEKADNSDLKFLHMIVIASKPDIIKQAPLIMELKKRKEHFAVAHTGQHYDWNYSGGLEEEFGIIPDFNLNIKGTTYQKTAQIIERLGAVIEYIQKRGKIVVPYVHGDTSTCMAASNAAYANAAACVHVEAGLRTMTPKKEIFDALASNFNFEAYYQALQEEKNWERGSIEPYPEQFNTRAAGPAIGFHAAPTKLNRKHLKAEGYYTDRVFVTGNSVVDATKFAMDRAGDSKIFEKYPILKDGFIRFCVHRRENLNSRHRFLSIFEAMEELIKAGKNILLISLNGTEQAIDFYGLRGRIKELTEKYPNFIYSLVWPFYTDVIAAMEKATVCATDSGSMQEEMNYMGIPCVTLRFNSDRPESAMCGGNLIAPPINKDVVLSVVRAAEQNADKLKQAPKIYGKNPSRKIIKGVIDILEKEGKLFRWEHERLGYDKLPSWQKGEMKW